MRPRGIRSTRGLLSNRTPNNFERATGLPVLKVFRESFPCDQVIALGKIATAKLGEIGVDALCVRHPASGGAKLFRQQIAKIVERQSSTTLAVRSF
jgi:hypothetical protein